VRRESRRRASDRDDRPGAVTLDEPAAAIGVAAARPADAHGPRDRLEPGSHASLIADHVRGSSLMLAGRLAALVVAFLTQILIVRHLSTGDYGAFAYALSAVLLLQSLLPLGMDRSDTRFLAFYDERRDQGRLLGVIVLEAGTVLLLGGVAIAGAAALRGSLEDSLTSNARSFDVLLALLALAPVQALDTLVVNVFAVFAKPWSVFFRRYVLDPGLRLLVAVALVATNGGGLFLALGYVGAGLLGVAIYSVLLVRLLARLGFLSGASLRWLVLPVREVFAFSLPLLLTNVVAVASTELAAVVLGHYHASASVAAFRAVEPLAALNLVVMYSFTTLFTPAAARLYARGDREGLRRLYWQSACWVAVLTFPVLCVTTALADPVTVAAFGDRYSGSALYLALLSAGYYVNAALGFNGITVLMLGRLRYLTIGNLAVLAWIVGVDLVLIPPWGATGAVVAVLSSVVVHNVVKQAGLGFGGGIGIFDRQHAVVLLQLTLVVVALNVVMLATSPPLAVGLAVVAFVTFVLMRLIGPALDLDAIFPELARMRLLRWMLR
jgi:O-antigen/teichoic acid export membrane protein